jgi:DNA-binding HxlR family transcriptional regulator
MTNTAKNKKKISHPACTAHDLMAVRDALYALTGTWKLPILMALSAGPKRFKELSKEVAGISDKMLSKELKDLELNHLVKRTVYDSFPPTVEYTITDYKDSLNDVITELRNWGLQHRKKVTGK